MYGGLADAEFFPDVPHGEPGLVHLSSPLYLDRSELSDRPLLPALRVGREPSLIGRCVGAVNASGLEKRL